MILKTSDRRKLCDLLLASLKDENDFIPLTDVEIAGMFLEKHGVKIAPNTVGYLRDKLGIPNHLIRRQKKLIN